MKSEELPVWCDRLKAAGYPYHLHGFDRSSTISTLGISGPSKMNRCLLLLSNSFIIQSEDRSDRVLPMSHSFDLLLSHHVWALCLPSRGSQSNKVRNRNIVFMQCKDTIIDKFTRSSGSMKKWRNWTSLRLWMESRGRKSNFSMKFYSIGQLSTENLFKSPVIF